MNKKSLLGFFFISLLLASFIFSANLVLAQVSDPNTNFDASLDTDAKVQASTTYGSVEEYRQAFGVDKGPGQALPATISSNSFTMERLRNVALVDLWLKGYNSANFSIAGEFVKIMLLILLILLVYSSLSYAHFLNGGVRFIVSIIIGLLATFLISTEALLTSLHSFTALGTAIWIFLPILVLTFFTIMVSSSAAPFGIFIQKILWVIYSVYTFISGLVVFSLAQSKSGNVVAQFFNNWIVTPLYGNNSAILAGMTKNADATTAVLLIVVSIVVFWIAVVKGHFFNAWLAKEKRDADLMNFQSDVERQAAKRRIEAEDTKGKKE